MRISLVVLAAAALVPLWAQEMRLPANLEALSAKAEESVDVTLDGNMLRLAAKWLPDTGEDAKAKKLIAGLEGIYVRSYQFAAEGEYNKADVDAVRSQFRGPGWSRIVGARSKRHGGDADVFIKADASGNIGGIVVIATEPRELTIVNIAGSIDPTQITDLGGRFHIPILDLTSCNNWRRESK
jgi:hypothetical protein